MIEVKNIIKSFGPNLVLDNVSASFFPGKVNTVEEAASQWIPIQKKMYVSPFADKQGLYQFKISSDPLNIKINEYDPNGKLEILSNLSGQKINFSWQNKLLIFFSIF